MRLWLRGVSAASAYTMLNIFSFIGLRLMRLFPALGFESLKSQSEAPETLGSVSQRRQPAWPGGTDCHESTGASRKVVTDVTDCSPVNGLSSRQRKRDPSGLQKCLDEIKEEKVCKMKNKQALERLMTERWPKLKKRAQNENNPEKLITILEEIDDLLFSVEMRIAADSGRTHTRGDGDSRSVRRESGAAAADDSEIGSP